ncbi:unnamed protein product (macronuclear) [Paramecium tetraurelia]|uniref:Protein kinase domain-containing protein n=1 Tax=Paramecium tetraurelia TaxID=5888 RepID=A0CQY1_PARTE|nr:uncharacterized protein GSPATT00038854001 [Paramecium tetraurelia]CAK73198.1 unnamed protein product [Paramecium tetraurelia]|eukprot:XP_001440595.1 hypothetical protein (macronuclear) [Paramecium tetraurelia strain d4-2]
MKYHQLSNCYVEAKTKEYQNRRFLLQQHLGSGSEGAAYLANAENWGNNPQQVVIKIQKNMKANERDFLIKLIQYQNQYENGNNLQYQPSQLIKIYDFFEWKENQCIIMEVGQENLYEYIGNKMDLSMEQRVKICFQICQPIYFLHSQKLVHRDIKPENYSKVGDIFKLIDFGLIRGSISDNKTQQVSSAIFQAPEILENSSSYTEKVDIWSLGCVFYEILSTQPLFDGQTIQQVLTSIRNHKNQPFITNNKIKNLKISSDVKEILIKMIQYQDHARPTIEWVQQKLKQQINTPPFQKYKQINELNFNSVISEKIQDLQPSQIPFYLDQQAITECNTVFEKLIKDGQKQFIDILNNQNQGYKSTIAKLQTDYQAQNQVNQNKINQQNDEINEMIKQLENLKYNIEELRKKRTYETNKFEQDYQLLRSEFEQFQQKSKQEEEKFNTENNQLKSNIQEFVENLNKANQYSQRQKKENENIQQEFQKLQIQNQNYQITIQELQVNLKEASNPINQSKSLMEFIQNLYQHQKIPIQEQIFSQNNEDKSRDCLNLSQNVNLFDSERQINSHMKQKQFSLQQIKQYTSIILYDLINLLSYQVSANYHNINNDSSNQEQTQDEQKLNQPITQSQDYPKQQQLKGQEGNIANIEQQIIESSEDGISQNLESIQEYKDHIENLKNELLKQVNQYNQQHKDQINVLNKEISDLKNQIDILKLNFIKEQQQSNEQNIRIENRNKDLSKQLQDLTKQLQESKEANQKIEDNNKDLTKQLQNKSNELQVSYENNIKIENSNKDFTKQLQDSQQQLKEFKQISIKENQSLKQELENLQKKTQEDKVRQGKEVDELKRTIKELQEKDKKQNLEISTQNKTLQEFEQQIKSVQIKLDQEMIPLNKVKALTDFFRNPQNLKEFSDKYFKEYMQLVENINSCC